MSRRASERGARDLVVFGRHAVEAALRSEGAKVHALGILRDRPAAERKALRAEAHARGLVLEELSRAALHEWTGAPRHDQGIAARVELRRILPLESFLADRKGAAAGRPTRLLGLEGVTNSQNVGMVVRSVVAAGLAGLVWPLSGLPWVNGLVVRAAAGALFECPILVCEDLESGCTALQAAGIELAGLDAAAPRSLFETPPPHRVAYLLGSERDGLSEAVRARLDQRLSIPMAGGLESLNVAVSAGLVAYHAAGLSSVPPAD